MDVGIGERGGKETGMLRWGSRNSVMEELEGTRKCLLLEDGNQGSGWGLRTLQWHTQA